MRLLVIGGTRCLGRHLVAAAPARGDSVTHRPFPLLAGAGRGRWPAGAGAWHARPAAADTLAWWQALPAAQPVFAATGLAPEREAAALAAMPGRQAEPRTPRA